MNEPYLGMILIYAFNWPPRGWATCSGQLLSIAQNQALFSLLGTTYGGNGVTTFALPDLRGRVALGMGQGNGLANYTQGQTAGSSTQTLTVDKIPPHSHTINATNEAGNSGSPVNAYFANSGARDNEYKSAPGSNSLKAMNAGMMNPAGGSLPVNMMKPYVTLNYCIALAGVFPSRD